MHEQLSGATREKAALMMIILAQNITRYQRVEVSKMRLCVPSRLSGHIAVARRNTILTKSSPKDSQNSALFLVSY